MNNSIHVLTESELQLVDTIYETTVLYEVRFRQERFELGSEKDCVLLLNLIQTLRSDCWILLY